MAGWCSHVDEGQAAAINEGIAQGRAPFVCWLNSDDWFLTGRLIKLLERLQAHAGAPAVYGRAWNVAQKSGCHSPVWVEPDTLTCNIDPTHIEAAITTRIGNKMVRAYADLYSDLATHRHHHD